MGTAVILVVGDELLSGHTLDTNSHWLRQRLADRGYATLRVETIPDEPTEIAATLKRIATGIAPTWIFLLGGIGPTPDDRTYEGLALALDAPLVVEPRNVEWARGHAKARGLPDTVWYQDPIPPPYRRMIALPQGAIAIDNPQGSALGCIASLSSSKIVVLPGVPSEFKAMMSQVVEPKWVPQLTRDEVVLEVTTSGAEALLWDLLNKVVKLERFARIGSYPQPDGKIILRVKGSKAAAVRAVEKLREGLEELEKDRAAPGD